jgi:titin
VTLDIISLGTPDNNNTIGGTAPGAGNLLSGDRVGILDQGNTNRIEGNRIGTDATGTVALGKQEYGVELFGSHCILGGTAAGDSNLISGNNIGVVVGGQANAIEGNFIGTDVSGTQALGNGTGVEIAGTSNTIGGTTAGARNLISGNGNDGVLITGNSNLVAGNYVGTDVSGTKALGNAKNGVEIGNASLTGSNLNTVGGTTTGSGNVIAFNGHDGVFIANGIADAIQQNSIFANTGLGIDLNAATNSNNLQAAPVLISAALANGKLTLGGSLTSTPNTTFTLEFFSNPAGTSQGKTFLGFITVTTDATGQATFTISFFAKVSKGQVITATATDSGGDTSEFSNGEAVT